LRRGLRDFPDELVTEDAGETHVAFGDLQIGGADAGLSDADEALAIGLGFGLAGPEGEGLVEDEGAHAVIVTDCGRRTNAAACRAYNSFQGADC
jgi:hypothetical protein